MFPPRAPFLAVGETVFPPRAPFFRFRRYLLARGSGPAKPGLRMSLVGAPWESLLAGASCFYDIGGYVGDLLV
jgi:hypothetical protein